MKLKIHSIGRAFLGFSSSFYVLSIGFAIFFIGITRPAHNWDMIGYMASAYYQDGVRGGDLSIKTYKDLKVEVGDAYFDEFVKGDYREGVYRDPEALKQQIPFLFH